MLQRFASRAQASSASSHAAPTAARLRAPLPAQVRPAAAVRVKVLPPSPCVLQQAAPPPRRKTPPRRCSPAARAPCAPPCSTGRRAQCAPPRCSAPTSTSGSGGGRLAPQAAAPRRSTSARVAARAEPAAAPAGQPRLEDLEMLPVLNVRGLILPEVHPESQAWVFGVYDESKTLQYVGFSKDLRSSLRTLFARRPDKAHHYRTLGLPALDQGVMLAVRNAWFDQNYGPPPGNKLPTERAAWQAPPESLAINERAKAAAADELLKQVLNKIRQRGCRELFEPDPEAMAAGKVDFLPPKALTPEETEAARAAAEEAAASTRRWRATVDGQRAPMELGFAGAWQTNGGWMYDVVLTCQDKESRHRVIIGRPYYEPLGLDPRDAVARVFAFLLRKKVPRSTEGMILSSVFPINYFSVSEVDQFFDDFSTEFEDVGELPQEGGFWRFNRTQDYGYKGGNETGDQLRDQFQLV